MGQKWTKQDDINEARQFIEHMLQSIGIARRALANLPPEERLEICRNVLKDLKKSSWKEFSPQTWDAFVQLVVTVRYMPGDTK